MRTSTAIRPGYCTEHRDRRATHVMFGEGGKPGTVGYALLGPAGVAWDVCAWCAGNASVACVRPAMGPAQLTPVSSSGHVCGRDC